MQINEIWKHRRNKDFYLIKKIDTAYVFMCKLHFKDRIYWTTHKEVKKLNFEKSFKKICDYDLFLYPL